MPAVVAFALSVGTAQATPGALDPSFGSGGEVLTALGSTGDAEVNGVAVQSDGKIVAVGYCDGSNFAVTRYNPDGSLDGSFGAGGAVLTDFGAPSNADGVALQTDGKLVVTGYTFQNGVEHFAVVRYNADGQLDASFGAGGKVLTDFGTGGAQPYAVAVEPAGELVVAGYSFHLGASGGVVSSDFALARYNPDGSLDSSFGVGGMLLTKFGIASDDRASALALQTGGKIVAAGVSNAHGSYDFALARFTRSGALDPSFGVGGEVLTDFSAGSTDWAKAAAAQTDGKFVAAGYSSWPSSGMTSLALARYTKRGALDATFGSGGTVVTDFGGDSVGNAVAAQTDGKIVAAGYSAAIGRTDFALARFNADGSLDTTFGDGGKVLTDFGASSDDEADALLLRSDGNIVAGGYSRRSDSTVQFALARYAGS